MLGRLTSAALSVLAAFAVPSVATDGADTRAGASGTPPLRIAQSESRKSSRPITKPPASRPPGPIVPPSKPRPVVCIGGKVVSGVCICPRGTRLAGRFCRPRPGSTRPDPDANAKPDVPGRAPPAKPPSSPPPKPRPQHPALTPPSGPTRVAPGPALTPGPAISASDVFVADEIVALAATGAPASVGGDIARDFGLVLLDETAVALTGDRLLRFRIPDGRAVPAVVAALAADTRVEGPQPNFVYRADQGSSAKPAPPDLQYALAKVDLAGAHAVATGSGVLVAVIDSGVDANHPDLAGAIEGEIDLTAGSAESTKPRAAPLADPHGTAVAGIIAARGLVRGIAPSARILSLRAFAPGLAGAPATATTAVLVIAMDRSADRGAAIFNLSFAGPPDPLLHRLVKAVAARGGMIVAAAGNNGPGAPPVYPGGYPEVIAVTAIDATDRLYAKANRGAYVEVAAPGVDILAPGLAKSHQMQSGTSFAAALVSGILALMRERTPSLALDDARRALLDAAFDLGAPGHDDEFGAGRVDAAGALRGLGATKR